MKENLTKADVTPEVIGAVTDLLAKMAIAQVTREEVDQIQRAILIDHPLYTDPREDRQTGIMAEPERILDPDRTWLASSESLEPYYNLCDAAERKAGIKPPEMERDFCPALVAENEQLKAEWALMDASAAMLDLDIDGKTLNNRLMCEPNGKGLERRQEWIDLLIGLVVNLDN